MAVNKIQKISITHSHPKALEMQKCYQKETVQLLPSGDHTTKKCVLVRVFSPCYPIIAGRKDKKNRKTCAKKPKEETHYEETHCHHPDRCAVADQRLCSG